MVGIEDEMEVVGKEVGTKKERQGRKFSEEGEFNSCKMCELQRNN